MNSYTLSFLSYVLFLFVQQSFSYDWIYIRDGGNKNAPLIGKELCGYTKPDPIFSSNNELFLRFHFGHRRRSDYRIRVELGKI